MKDEVLDNKLNNKAFMGFISHVASSMRRGSRFDKNAL